MTIGLSLASLRNQIADISPSLGLFWVSMSLKKARTKVTLKIYSSFLLFIPVQQLNVSSDQ